MALNVHRNRNDYKGRGEGSVGGGVGGVGVMEVVGEGDYISIATPSPPE